MNRLRQHLHQHGLTVRELATGLTILAAGFATITALIWLALTITIIAATN